MKKISAVLYTRLCAYAFLLVSIPACVTQQPAVQYPMPEVPGSYSNRADSSSLSSLTREQFFRDAVLLGLIDTAIKNNLTLKTTVEKIMIARAHLLVQKGLRLPSLNGFASGAVDKYGKYTMTGVGNFDTNLSQNITEDQKVTDPPRDFFLGLKSSWEIDLWGKLKAKKRSAYNTLLASEKGRHWVTTQLVTQVASYYYELLALDNRLEIIRRNITLQERAVEIVEAQMEGGRANALAVQQFSAHLMHTLSLEQETRLAIIQLENEMNVLLGRFAQTPIPRGLPIRQQQTPEVIASGIPADLLTRRPDIQQAALELAASKADVTAARKAFLPSVTLTPYLALNAFKLPLLFNGSSIAYGLLGGITQPLFNQHQLKAGFAVANAEQTIAFYNYRQSILQGYGEVLGNLKGIEHYMKIVDLNQSEVGMLTDAVSTSTELYLNGYASYLEVITAQKGVLEAELKRTASQKELLTVALDLYRSLGGGWE